MLLQKLAHAQCGSIRETSILTENEVTDAALVEFRQVEAVPAALARDRKKLDGREVSVSMLWRSTLFVTNFSRDSDDAALRQLFSQVSGLRGFCSRAVWDHIADPVAESEVCD